MGRKRKEARRGPRQEPRPGGRGDERLDSRKGFTLAEVMVSTVVVGVGISAAMFGLGTSAANSGEGQNVLTAQTLAADILDYSQGLAFSEPGGGDVFGPEPGENGLEDFDDINDLDGLILSPPAGPDGEPLAAYAGWSQVISVHALDPATFERLENPGDPDLVEIEVEIDSGTRRIAAYQRLATRR